MDNFDNTIFSHHLTIYFFPCIDTQKIQLTTHHGNSDGEIDEKFILRINLRVGWIDIILAPFFGGWLEESWVKNNLPAIVFSFSLIANRENE